MSDARSIFAIVMHSFRTEVRADRNLTLFAAWNAAIYVAQIEDVRLSRWLAMAVPVEATDRVLKRRRPCSTMKPCDFHRRGSGMIPRVR